MQMSVAITQPRPRRSALYLPGSNARAIHKAQSLPCDVVLLDLEDAVAPEAKRAAREQTCEAVGARVFGRREVVVRVNSLDTEWGHEDVKAISQAKPDAILLPKIDCAADVHSYHALLSPGTDIKIWVMAETAHAFMNLREIAATSLEVPLACIVVGTNDLGLELGATLDVSRTAVLTHLSTAILVARTFGLTALDGVYNQFEDGAGFDLQCLQGRDLGFDGKTLIHPAQISSCNSIFTPNTVEIEWARRVVVAFNAPENASRGALRLDGKMIERLHLLWAKRTLARAEGVP